MTEIVSQRIVRAKSLIAERAAILYCLLVIALSIFLGTLSNPLHADSRGEELAQWLNERGAEFWGDTPELCDDLTFARRIYLDLLGRVPSVSEIRDFEALPNARRRILVDSIVFAEGERATLYSRLSSRQLARQWRQVLLPSTTNTVGAPKESMERWLAEEFEKRETYDRVMEKLVSFDSTSAAPQYFQAVGSLPENYAGHISRALLGVRIECAQCHDHPFTDWKQTDFWGLAAFYGDLGATVPQTRQGVNINPPGKISFEGKEYSAKLLGSAVPFSSTRQPRSELGQWLTSRDNPQFAATAVNRFWQQLIGRGMVSDVENLDQASPPEREFLDEFAQRFADCDFQTDQLLAAICKSNWYAAVSSSTEPLEQEFHRPLKSISPEQIFDSLEQALQLPIGRLDSTSPRYSGEGTQLMNRLSEATGAAPEDYVSGIPQALLLMNGSLTTDAIDLEKSRLLRAVIDSPFFDQPDQLETLYLAVLTRRPTPTEAVALTTYCDSRPVGEQRQALGEVLWALLNSPEFVLCR